MADFTCKRYCGELTKFNMVIFKPLFYVYNQITFSVYSNLDKSQKLEKKQIEAGFSGKFFRISFSCPLPPPLEYAPNRISVGTPCDLNESRSDVERNEHNASTDAIHSESGE